MAHRALHDFIAEFACFGEQFRADETAVGHKVEVVDHFAPDEFERGVDVAHVNAKNRAHDEVVKLRAQYAIPRVGALPLIAAHDGDVLFEQRQQIAQFVRIVLHVAVGVKNQIILGRVETGFERGAVADVINVMLHHDVFVFLRALVRDIAGVVETAVIDDDDFPLLRHLAQNFARGEHELFHRSGIVKRRKKKRNIRFAREGGRGLRDAVAASLHLPFGGQIHDACQFLSGKTSRS